jgi:capsular polysaccharide biosynthesis protein
MNGFVDFTLALRERIFQVAAILVIGTVATTVYVSRMAEEYTAYVQVSIDPEIAPIDSSTETDQNGDLRHHQIVEQKIFSRPFLEQVISELREQTQLPLVHKGMQLDATRLREQLDIQPVGGSRGGWQPQSVPVAIVISATLEDPDLTVQVVNRLATAFLSFDRKIRLDKAQVRQRFYRRTSEAIGIKLAEAETQISEYRVEHAMGLPSAIVSLHDRISYLDTDITNLDRRQAAIVDTLGKEVSYRELQKSKELKGIKAERDLLVSKRDKLYAQLRSIPANEKHLNALIRNKERYASQDAAAFARVAQADLDVEIAQTEWLASLSIDGFSEHPLLNGVRGRDKAYLLGLALTIGLAALYVFLLEVRRPTVRTAAQLEQVIGITPLVSISYVSTAAENVTSLLTRASLFSLALMAVYAAYLLL